MYSTNAGKRVKLSPPTLPNGFNALQTLINKIVLEPPVKNKNSENLSKYL
jgi:hypothetical protein